MKRVLILGLSGLNTTVENFRARAFMEQVKTEINSTMASRFQCETKYATYDTITLESFQQMIAGYDIIIVIAHSFGGAAIKWLLDQMSLIASHCIDLVLALDPAPNADRFHQFFSWQLADQFDWARWRWPENVVDKALTYYQSNGANTDISEIPGICGVPFHEVDGRFRNINVGQWGLSHNNMVEDPHVQALMKQAILEIALEDVLFPDIHEVQP